MATTDAATINPTAHIDPTVLARFQRSYVARRGYKDEVQRPPATMGVKGVIDIHCHAHEGQQDALAVAQHASASGMGGILFKTIPGRQGQWRRCARFRRSCCAGPTRLRSNRRRPGRPGTLARGSANYRLRRMRGSR